MCRFFSVLSLVAAILTIPLGSGSLEAQEVERIESVVSQSAVERDIYEALEQEVNFEFVDSDFNEVHAQLSEDYGIPILIDESAEQSGLTNHTSVTSVISGVSLRSALQNILRPLNCTFAIYDEALHILSKDYAADHLQTQIYDLSQFDVDFDDLISTISDSLAPDSWASNGGTGVIKHLNLNSRNLLVVTQTESGQFQLKTLLNSYRIAVTGKPPIAKTDSSDVYMYRVDEKLNTKAADLVDLVKDSLTEVTWESDSHFVRAYGSVVVVRHSNSALDKIDSALQQIGLRRQNYSSSVGIGNGKGSGGFGGGGLFNIEDESDR